MVPWVGLQFVFAYHIYLLFIAGELCQMECIVRGSPLPKVLWLKNNRPLKESDGCQVIADEETNILVFPEVREDDVGVYTARAMNVNGSVMSTAELNLEDGNVKHVSF